MHELPTFEKKRTAHYPRRRAVAGALARSPSAAVYVYPRALSLGDDSATTAALRQVPRSSSGSVPSPATSTHQVPPPSIPCLLCKTEHPKPNLSYFGYL